MRDPLRLHVLRFTVCLFSLSTLFCLTALAQTVSEFSGTVTDADGQPIAGVEVWLIPMETGEDLPDDLKSIQGKSTDETGSFSMPFDVEQSWVGLVYKKGFAPAIHQLL